VYLSEGGCWCMRWRCRPIIEHDFGKVSRGEGSWAEAILGLERVQRQTYYLKGT
jgi:hypothetical protein